MRWICNALLVEVDALKRRIRLAEYVWFSVASSVSASGQSPDQAPGSRIVKKLCIALQYFQYSRRAF